jgi:hypothetical protein
MPEILSVQRTDMQTIMENRWIRYATKLSEL